MLGLKTCATVHISVHSLASLRNNSKPAYHKFPFLVDHFSKFLRDLLEYIKGWDQLVWTEVCASALIWTFHFLWLLPCSLFQLMAATLSEQAQMVMSQGNEGVELNNETRRMSHAIVCWNL